MKAIILAAGRATRLLPLTKENPQCLLKIGTKTILEKQIDYIKKAGIEVDANFILGHPFETIESIKTTGSQTMASLYVNLNADLQTF